MNQTRSLYLSRQAVRPDDSHSPDRLRVLLYSHDSYGLGHLRRNLAIAGAITQQMPRASALLVAGSPCATQFPLPPRCDVIKIPAVGKNEAGDYVPRSLGLSLNRTVALRRQLLNSAYRSYDPDVVIVDHQPAGLMGEAMDVLRQASEAGKLVLFGMRDIVDATPAVEAAWSSAECRMALEEYYSRILVYGDARVFDPIREYPLLRPLHRKVSQLGYIAGEHKPIPFKPVNTGRKQVLVTVGGGDDGAQRVQAYLDALECGTAGWYSHIVTGPLMDRNRVRAFKHRVRHGDLSGKVKISRFHGDIPGLMRRSDAIVSMAGYNSCLEILQSGTPAVLLPREHMRQEQALRAARWVQLGLAQTAPLDEPRRLYGAISDALDSDPIDADPFNLNGLSNLCGLLQESAQQRLTAAGSA